MSNFERFAELTSLTTLKDWRDRIFKISEDFGYTSCAVAIFPTPLPTKDIEAVFLQTNYAPEWCSTYISEQLVQVDPVVAHCLTRSTPLVWWPDKFMAKKQREFFEEAGSHRICSGSSFPVHGPDGQHGIVTFASDTKSEHTIKDHATRNILELGCFRDFILETSLQFMNPAATLDKEAITLTQRELECLKWSAFGKSSWDIASIMSCSEAGINAHFNRIRQKFGTSTRRQAIVKAIRMGIISPS